jgi:methionyl-tRNA synthetase
MPDHREPNMAESAVIEECQKALDALVESECEYCGGQLTTGTYKDTDAVLCEACETPAIRFW